MERRQRASRCAIRRSHASGVVLAVLLLSGSGALALDRGADGEFDLRTSAHFNLYQDVDIDQTGGFHGSRRFEKLVLDELEDAYESLDRLVGLRPRYKIDVVMYDEAVFDSQFGGIFRYPIAGFFRDRICVRSSTEMTPYLRHVLRHELVHAALQQAAPSYTFPAWVNEGYAEWFEYRALGVRGLSAGQWELLRAAKRSGSLFDFASLSGPSFGHLGPQQAGLAYVQSFGMIDFLSRTYGERKLDQLIDALIRSRNLDRALQRVYRADLARLQARFFEQLD